MLPPRGAAPDPAAVPLPQGVGDIAVMMIRLRRMVTTAVCVAVSVSGCAFGGLNSLPLPGAVGRGPGADTYHVELANVATLEPNSPVLVGDVVVGSVNAMKVRDWHADVEISVKPDVDIPANAVATVGQTSLLGSMHLALNPPLGQPPSGRLAPGATLGLNKTSTYPSTEQTLSALSVVINGGGVGQIGDIVNELNRALGGREPQIRDLLTRLNDFVGVLATQRDAINATVVSLNRVAGTFAGQRDVLTRALDRIPPALDVLVAATAQPHRRAGQARKVQHRGDRRGQRHPGRSGPQSAQPGADAAVAGRRGTRVGSGAVVLHRASRTGRPPSTAPSGVTTSTSSSSSTSPCRG